MTGKSTLGPWVIPGLAAVNVVVFALLWLGGTVGVAAAGYGWQPPPFSADVYFALVSGSSEQVWPGVPPFAVYGGALALAPSPRRRWPWWLPR
ncbi:hypothetical protein ACFQ1L_33570 [Phytohabitans flavus]|uniref:hypothetical protein n=1 Tax=Phytohabitans flavus TaxID=1076124 RepID=UPI0036321B5A